MFPFLALFAEKAPLSITGVLQGIEVAGVIPPQLEAPNACSAVWATPVVVPLVGRYELTIPVPTVFGKADLAQFRSAGSSQVVPPEEEETDRSSPYEKKK